jgi:hypothetical protein
MSRRRKILAGAFVLVVVVSCWVYAQVDLATRAIQFDLHSIGRSVYEAHRKIGKWPEEIAELDGTEYLNMPYRKEALEKGHFVIVSQQGLDPNPAANRDRILAFDNHSLLSRFGKTWVIRGDLRVEYMNRDELNELLKAVQD